MVMHNPPHPAEVIRELCIDPLGLTVTEAANGLGVSGKTLSSLLNGRFGIPAVRYLVVSLGPTPFRPFRAPVSATT